MSVVLEEVSESGLEPIPEHRRSKLSQPYTYFSAVVLSVWDNILGPQVHHVWFGPTAERLQPDIVQYVSSHTLNGEIVRTDFGEKPGDRISAKLFVFSEKRVCVTAFIFKGYTKSGPCLFSLCLVMTLDQLTSYLPLHDLCEAKMQSCVTKLIGMQKQGLPISRFSATIQAFVQSIANITLAPLSNVKVQDMPLFMEASLRPTSCVLQLQSTVFQASVEMFERDFLRRSEYWFSLMVS